MPRWTLAQRTFKIKDVLGDKIGQGQYREVFQYALEAGLIIKKIRKRPNCLHENKIEYTNWRNLHEIASINALLVPVKDISVCGSYLLMLKTEPLLGNDIQTLPRYVPVGYCDGHIRQLSKLNNKTIIHDYGCNLLKPGLKQISPTKFWKIK